MEVLVMLAITAVVSTLVLQTIRSATSNGLRIERHSRFTIHDRLDVNALRRAMSGTLIEYGDATHSFRGGPEEARGLTSRPIIPGHVAATPFRIGIESGVQASTLFYEEDGVRFELARSTSGSFRLTYWYDNGDAAGWISQWPPEAGFAQAPNTAPPYYVPVPALMRIAAPDNEFDLVMSLPRTAPPPARVEDLLGTSSQ